VPGDRERKDDELARTATALPETTATAPQGEAQPPVRDSGLSETLGRYKIGRELGRGGMGVVHSAFDPDLERKIALKVLPTEVENSDARQRLLREARAMARLSHPNVVTVHEVGTAHGRDFIAMELVDGATLEDWLEASPRSEREIVAAFIAAGRGLAAAHAAGLVHRDFKPRNVLRHKDGRIVVTDFGLVVGVESEVDAFKVTMPSGQATAKTTPSSLSGLTKTGSVLGTPAYMAPEQWTGGQVGPAADQFAFCVALWEALAKERPYKGSTIEELKTVVLGGKRTDESKLPRKLRKVLRRGLDPDPAKRYPSMGALLDAIARTERRPTVVFAIAGAAVVASAVVYAVAIRSPESKQTTYIVSEGCTAPVLDPEKVWTPRDGELLRLAHQDLAAASLERDFKAWTDVRARACKADAGVREPQLACLDSVLSRIDAVKQIALTARMPEASEVVEIDDLLVEPTLCETPNPPRLVRVISKEMRDVLSFYIGRVAEISKLTDADADAAIARGGSDPCATAVAHEYAAAVRIGGDRDGELAKAERDAQACGDDRLIADVAIASATLASSLGDVDYRSKFERAETLTGRVRQPDVEAQLEVLRSMLALRSDDLDETIAHLDKAIALYEQRQMFRSVVRRRLDAHRWRMRRAKPDEIAAAPAMLDGLRAQIVAKIGETDLLVRDVDRARATLKWLDGDLEGSNALRKAVAKQEPPKNPQVVSGQVVDDNGPVAGAQVWVGTSMFADPLYATVAAGGDQRTVTTDANGRFTVKDAEAKSLVVAQHGDLRAPPVWGGENMTVKLQRTSTVSGSVSLRDRIAQQVTLYVVPKDQPPELPYMLSAPLAPDGSFVLRGVPQGKMVFRTLVELSTADLVSSQELVVNKPEITGVRLEVKASGRPLHLLVRSLYGAPLATANVFVMGGKQPAEQSLAKVVASRQDFTAKLASKPLPEQQKPPVQARMKAGDLYALIASRPDGEVSACAIPLPEHLDDPQLVGLRNDTKKLEKISVRCVPVTANDDVVIVPVAPWPRFD
jgi:hypothetical protein